MIENFFENQILISACLTLSVMRVLFEITKFNMINLPIAKRLPKQKVQSFHNWGFYISLGYIFLFSPAFLLN